MMHCGIELRNAVLPPTAGLYAGKTCVILASGLSIFSDLEDVSWLLKDKKFDVMAVNLSFLAWDGELEHLVSLHSEKLHHFHQLAKGLPVDRVQHIHTHCDRQCDAEQVWAIVDTNGTSSLYAIKIAILLGYSKIICCGMDLDGKYRFYDNPYAKIPNNFSCEGIMYSWREWAQNEHFKEKVRAISGKTKELFGVVTPEWLEA
jgi:hypothetical protein